MLYTVTVFVHTHIWHNKHFDAYPQNLTFSYTKNILIIFTAATQHFPGPKQHFKGPTQHFQYNSHKVQHKIETLKPAILNRLHINFHRMVVKKNSTKTTTLFHSKI